MIRAASHAAFLAPASPIATVATGTPAGIWTIEYSESTPPRCSVGIGTPITGRSVQAATTPGRCAAPPAAAMTILMPRPAAEVAHSMTPRGSRCAERIFTSCWMPKASSCVVQPSISGRSDLLPRMTPTSGTDRLLCDIAAVEGSVESYPADCGEDVLAGGRHALAQGHQRQNPAPGGDQPPARQVARPRMEDQDPGRDGGEPLDGEPRLE